MMLSADAHPDMPASGVTEPQAHPMWATQVELERGMMREGADRVRDRVIEARRRNQMTRVTVVRGLLEDWLPAVADGIRDWCKTMARNRGVKPIALPYLQAMDPYVAGLVALRAILDGITTERTAVTALAVEIGRTVEHEAQVRLWEEKEPDLFYSIQKHLERTDATTAHRARVNINRFNAMLHEGKFGFGWTAWGPEVHFRVGVALIDAIVRVTQWFELRPDFNHVHKAGTKKGPKLILAAKPGLVEWLGKALDAAELSAPAFKPTVIPPKRWEGTRNGGYWTPYVKTPRLIRFKASQEEQKDRAADEYDAIHMPEVYAALHFLQEVPWRVNQRVFAVAEEVVTRDLGIAGVPVTKEAPLPPRQAGMEDPAWAEAHPEEVKRWKRAAAEVYRRNAKRLSQTRGVSRTLRVAKEYREFPCFYFPHMMDFRGRMYPIPVGLQPQGDDLARGLLEFGEGKPVTEENGGAGWLAIQLASCLEQDKMSFDDRIAWVEERTDLWRAIVADPLGNLGWIITDPKTGHVKNKPWQALAAVYDWVGFLDAGYGYVSHAPVAVDGTCNGIQHLSAMTRDEVAGEYVNLVPGEAPRDIYKFVARDLQGRLERIEADGGLNAEHAAYWLGVCKRDIPRSLTKRPVMVLPYGGTKDSFFTYTRSWLDEHDPLRTEELTQAEVGEALGTRTKRISFLVLQLWDAVNETVSGGMVVMKWLQSCAKKATLGNQPIFWVTPTGFVVRHFYGKRISKDVQVRLDGTSVFLEVGVTTKDLDVKSQLQGISPNFVHSMDAAALTLSLNFARADGVSAFTAVHDAYGCHAADMWVLFRHLRRAFVAVHESDVLAGFRAACAAVLTDWITADRGLDPLEASEVADDELPRMPARGRLELSEVLESDYFFA